MVRPRRIDPEMGIHHVFTRGSKRWTIFHDDVDRRRFMGQLSRVCDRYDIAVLAYALMDNHLHLVLRCPDGGLSDALRDLKSVYARWFNTRHRSSGPLFENRFGSKLVTSHRQIKTLVRYVHRNPLDIDPAMDLAGYPWSSHGMYLGLRPAPVWLDMQIARPLFTDYQAEVERPVASDSVRNVMVPGTITCPAGAQSLSDVVIAVARAAEKQVADVHPSKRNGLVGLAAIIAMSDLGLAPAEIFEPLGYRHYNALVTATSRARKRVRSNSQAAELLAEARSRLQQRAA